MFFNKGFIMAGSLSAAVLLASMGIKPVNEFKNLKILPKNIPEEKLDSIMNSYNLALNVDCAFCHVGSKEITNPVPGTDTLDYAADGQMKEDARKMIRLMIDINKNYFDYNKDVQPEYRNAVSCFTCHRGDPFPLDVAPKQ